MFLFLKRGMNLVLLDGSPEALNKILFLITLFLTLSLEWNPPIWLGYGDPYDYLHQSRIPLNDLEFYAPHKIPDFSPRPFTIPLFYKIADTKPELIIQMQKLVHCLSAFFLVFSLLLFIKRNTVKYFAIISIYLLMSWWNIVGWTITLLSESLSMSLMFCWIASFLLLLKKKDGFSLFIHMLITVLFSFTRDSWPYVIVLFYLITCFSFYRWEKTMFKKAIGLLAFSSIIFLVQQRTAETGIRYKLPLINSTLVRIIPNEKYTQWFAERGLPSTERLKKEFRGLNFEDENSLGKIYALYKDSTYQDLFNWTTGKGKGVYMQFLLSHPSYTLLFDESSKNLERIFSQNLSYVSNARGYSSFVQKTFPVFGVTSLLFLLVCLVFIFREYKLQILLIPLFITLVFTFNVFLTYNADGLEMERHLFVTTIIIQFTAILSLALVLDNVNIINLKKIFIKSEAVKLES
jgi:hypothetical protein